MIAPDPAASTDWVAHAVDIFTAIVTFASALIAAGALRDQKTSRKVAERGEYYRRLIADEVLERLPEFQRAAAAVVRRAEQLRSDENAGLFPDAPTSSARPLVQDFNDAYDAMSEPILAAVSAWGDNGLYQRINLQIEKLQDLNEEIPLILGHHQRAPNLIAEINTCAAKLIRIVISHDYSIDPDEEKQRRRLRAFHGTLFGR